MSKLSPEQFQAIFDRIEAGEVLYQICPEIGIPRGTFLGWLEADQTLSDSYARAQQLRADSWAERVVATGTHPTMTSDQKRAETDALKWAAGKAAPKKYGERLELGGDVTIRDKRVIDRAVEAAKAADE